MFFAAFVTVLLDFVVPSGALGPQEACWGRYRSANGSCVEAYLVFGHNQAIFRIDADGGNERRMVANTGSLVLLDFDYMDGRLYWADTDTGLIQSSLLNGTQRQKLHSDGKGIAGFAVDWIHNQVVWTNQEKGTMKRVGSNGKNLRILLENLSQPGSVAIDPNDRFIFWVSHGISPSIQRSNLDGEMTSTVLKTSDRLTTLSLDFSDKRLFWVQFGLEHRGAIGSCDYNGNIINIIKQPPLVQPWGVSLFLEHVYYTDSNTRTIKRLNKYTGDEAVTITLKYPLHPPTDIKMVHPLKQPLVEDPPNILTDEACDALDGSCSSVCSRDRDTGMCRCTDGFVLSKLGDRCEDVNECALWTHGCTLGCQNVPGSYVCTCPAGFLLLPDMKTCHGCSSRDNGGCSQRCVTLSPSRWECGCLPGYRIHADGKRCTATGPAPYLLLANIIDIRRINLDGTGDQSLLEETGGAVRALDYDPVQAKVYFASTALKQIERASLDGSGREVLVSEGVDLPEGVAVDWINRLLYWTDQGLSTIERCELNGLNREAIITHGLQKPRGIAIHPAAKRLFWTDVGAAPAVESTSLDGAERSVIAAAGLVSPTGLAIDYTADRLYWCDSDRGVVEVAGLDGSDRRILSENEVGRPLHIAVFEDLVWVTDWHHHLVLRVDKRTGRNLGRLHSNVAHPASIVIVHPLAKPVESRKRQYPDPVPLRNRTLNDGVMTSGPSHSPLSVAEEEQEPNPTLVTEKMVSDQDDCFSVQCDKHAQCLSSGYSATCQCVEGFEGDGTLCVDVDECLMGLALCSGQHAECMNTQGGYLCQCRSGFSWDGVHCSDIDECKLGIHNCDRNGKCFNSVGSYQCRCPAGYSGTGFACQAVSVHPLPPVAASGSPPPTTAQWQEDRTVERCPPSHDTYCLYEGVCFYFPEMESYGCNCVRGYMGERCQFSDLEWKELQRAEEASRRRDLTMGICTVGLITLLSLATYISYFYGSMKLFRKCPPNDDMSDTSTCDEESTTDTSSCTPMVKVWLLRKWRRCPRTAGTFSHHLSMGPVHLKSINNLMFLDEPLPTPPQLITFADNTPFEMLRPRCPDQDIMPEVPTVEGPRGKSITPEMMLGPGHGHQYKLSVSDTL
ncbi:hypothetical protein AAFF_G00314450 [Aldrovandia affinis]|uniref:EGF-like domain-containing protein n=1 Tax=Aldrovandia affinis TaxID=143900 RepID=A0AAD7VZV4_9TELE|nr:hypothetical protein AAFF_G00314450 [Aldrovandia affinis]